jgi:hypothetical protein
MLLAACRQGPPATAGETARPPAPLDSIGIASDARMDSSGALLGSFVGEGTARAVHLLSSDTGFIADLLARYRPDVARGRDRWAELARLQTATLDRPGRRAGAPQLVAASPLGHTPVRLAGLVVHGGRCGPGPGGAQAEMVIESRDPDGGVPLRGPVLGSFHEADIAAVAGVGDQRKPPPAPTRPLVAALVARTAAAADSLLVAEYGPAGAQADPAARLEFNTLADADAADVVAYRTSGGAVRYAVSLRVTRLSGSDTLVASSVMAWDSAGRWRQVIFRPTLLSLHAGRLRPAAASGRSLYWRRLQPVSDFAFQQDDLWMEQVDARTGTVLWGIVQPQGNVVVAAAEVDGPCR